MSKKPGKKPTKKPAKKTTPSKPCGGGGSCQKKSKGKGPEKLPVGSHEEE